MWNPTLSKIQYWFDQKIQEFDEAENQNPRSMIDKWMERYIHKVPHKLFFCEFPIILYEWLAQFTYKKKKFQGGEPTSWIPELIQELQETDNNTTRAIEVWLDSILEGYINEFAVDTTKSYSEAKGEFFNGPRGRFLLSL